MSRERQPWAYKGINVHPVNFSPDGIRWWALTPWGRLCADTKDTMRELISDVMADNGITGFSYRRRW